MKGKVREILEGIDEKNILDEISVKLDLEKSLNRDIKEISGGELQSVAIVAALLREADVYVFDEPSSYLDVKQRLKVAAVIRR